jgi:hypothetical protein
MKEDLKRKIFFDELNEITFEKLGISYSNIVSEFPAFDDGDFLVLNALSRYDKPGSFVDFLTKIYNLKNTSELPGEKAFFYNTYRCSLIDFGKNSEDWTLAQDGNLYKKMENNKLMRLDFNENFRSNGKSFNAYRISISENVANFENVDSDFIDRKVIDTSLVFIPIAKAFDIQDVIKKANLVLENQNILNSMIADFSNQKNLVPNRI